MTVHKLGTKALKELGLPLEFYTCEGGYVLFDPRFFKQTGSVYRTAFKAVNEAMAGARPEEVE